jgi:hypothetical protein
LSPRYFAPATFAARLDRVPTVIDVVQFRERHSLAGIADLNPIVLDIGLAERSPELPGIGGLLADRFEKFCDALQRRRAHDLRGQARKDDVRTFLGVQSDERRLVGAVRKNDPRLGLHVRRAGVDAVLDQFVDRDLVGADKLSTEFQQSTWSEPETCHGNSLTISERRDADGP